MKEQERTGNMKGSSYSYKGSMKISSQKQKELIKGESTVL